MTGKAHAGTDCLIFKKELYRNNFMLGDVSLGHVGIGRALRVYRWSWLLKKILVVCDMLKPGK
jgi:hypothetical protein